MVQKPKPPRAEEPKRHHSDVAPRSARVPSGSSWDTPASSRPPASAAHTTSSGLRPAFRAPLPPRRPEQFIPTYDLFDDDDANAVTQVESVSAQLMAASRGDDLRDDARDAAAQKPDTPTRETPVDVEQALRQVAADGIGSPLGDDPLPGAAAAIDLDLQALDDEKTPQPVAVSPSRPPMRASVPPPLPRSPSLPPPMPARPSTPFSPLSAALHIEEMLAPLSTRSLAPPPPPAALSSHPPPPTPSSAPPPRHSAPSFAFPPSSSGLAFGPPSSQGLPIAQDARSSAHMMRPSTGAFPLPHPSARRAFVQSLEAPPRPNLAKRYVGLALIAVAIAATMVVLAHLVTDGAIWHAP